MIDTLKKDNKVRLNRVYTFILYFFIFAFLGWIMETLYCRYELGYFSKRGFLYGPICPIYGFGSLILILFLARYRKSNIKLFIYSIVTFSIFEYIVGYGMDAIFSLKWWDYTDRFLNINGRISIFHSFAWGFIAIIFINYIYPFIKKKVNIILSKLPYFIQINFIRMLIGILIIDTIFSFIRYIL